ncbi:MAG TPA: DUF5615 family PIN-like protein [Saprospiraceae bacterium]|nr:DUF5615 family PIN-like protein [Saprospiraceae bacterium]HMQ81820.1 DUF5615 family PIN-like protein [Saprospiraceae bacterium]
MKKFLADESVDFRLVKSLRLSEYDVEAVIETHAGITDEEVLELANKLNAILITEDKDFGELTYRLKKPSKGIILLRLSGVSINDKINKVKEVLENRKDKLYQSFTLIGINKVRIKEM